MISTPVGPPPITTNVSQRRRSVSWRACAACSRHAKHVGCEAAVPARERLHAQGVRGQPRIASLASGTRPRLDAGVLGITVLGAGADGRSEKRVQQWSAPSFEVRSDRPVAAGTDGEALKLDPRRAFAPGHTLSVCESPHNIRALPIGHHAGKPVGRDPRGRPHRDARFFLATPGLRDLGPEHRRPYRAHGGPRSRRLSGTSDDAEPRLVRADWEPAQQCARLTRVRTA